MSLSSLPLCYCSNVHAWKTFGEIRQGLPQTTARLAELADQPLSAGLWFSDSLSREIAEQPGILDELAGTLAETSLTCHTLNAFPYGDFHAERVKEQVYLPDWTDRRRLDYTLRCARILAHLLPPGREGSISTMPLGFAPAAVPEDFFDRGCQNLCAAAIALDQLHSDTGRVIRLAIEPEPFCRIETTSEAIDFFATLREEAQRQEVGQLVEEHIGLCYDICHQSVLFEDHTQAIGRLSEAGIRINKVHISSAIELADPMNNAAGRDALRDFAEPRYLHQTFGRTEKSIARQVDLSDHFCDSPPADFAAADSWRVHFHVPVNEQTLGPLGTTGNRIPEALKAIRKLEYAPHLEVETYTWSVLPGATKPELTEGLARELVATSQMLKEA